MPPTTDASQAPPAEEDHGLLDLLAAVADHEKPLELKSPVQEFSRLSSPAVVSDSIDAVASNPVDITSIGGDGASIPSLEELNDEQLSSLLGAEQPSIDLTSAPFNHVEDAELAALFADLPEMTSQHQLLDDQALMASLSLPADGGMDPMLAMDEQLNAMLSPHVSEASLPETAPSALPPAPPPSAPSPPVRVMSLPVTSDPRPTHQMHTMPALKAHPPPQSKIPPRRPVNSSQPEQTTPTSGTLGAPFRPPPQSMHSTPSARPQSHAPTPHPSQPGPGNVPARETENVLENLLTQVPPGRRDEFRRLYDSLKEHRITAQEFTDRAQAMLPPVLPQKQPLSRPQLQSSTTPLPGLGGPAEDMRRRKAQQTQQYAGMGRGTPTSVRPVQMQQHTPLTQQYRPQSQQPPYLSSSSPYPPPPSSTRPGAPAPDPDVLKAPTPDEAMDVMSSAGLNMKEEEDNLANSIAGAAQNSQHGQHQPYVPTANRSRDQSFLNLASLRRKVETVAQSSGVTEVDRDMLPFLALAVQERMRDLVERMIRAAKHRTGVLHEQFLRNERAKMARGEDALDLQIVVKADTKKLLANLEKRERAREAKLQADKAATDGSGPQGGAASGGGEGVDGGGMAGSSASGLGEDGLPRKRKKIKGESRDLPEHVRLERANAALSAAIGGAPLKSWMMAGAAGGSPSSAGTSGAGNPRVVPLGKKRRLGDDDEVSGSRPLGSGHGSLRLPGSKRRGGEAVPARKVTLRDALFCLEGEHAMTKSLVVYKWWANVT
ncbi:hypothetical protein HKX48_004643 [Thoreauomyces humboldtii]|nr:hypothetical protein HKX48_004643 [Thoreauomyces humboldtii]